MMILEVEGVTKYFSRRGKSNIVANDNISFDINEGEIFGFWGRMEREKRL